MAASLPAECGRRRAIAPLGAGSAEVALALSVLPEMSRHLGVTVPHTGHLISAYAPGALVGAPPVTTLIAKTLDWCH